MLHYNRLLLWDRLYISRHSEPPAKARRDVDYSGRELPLLTGVSEEKRNAARRVRRIIKLRGIETHDRQAIHIDDKVLRVISVGAHPVKI